MSAGGIRGALLLAVTLLGTIGCGYRLAGTSTVNSAVPEDVEIVAVLIFENRTNRPEIEQRVTERLARELSRRGRLRVQTAASGADAVLQGAITNYDTRPVEFTDTGRAERREALMTIQASLRDAETDELLWSQTGLLFRQQFDVPESGEFFDQETLALDALAANAANAVVTSMLEGF